MRNDLVHFVHTSDWHLGFFQYNKSERFFDFRDAAAKIAKKIIQINPQFVLHTGDIFHHARPSPGTIRQAVKILKKIDDAGIRTYIIRGNHDGRNTHLLQRGGSIISLLKDLKLVKYINNQIVEIPDQDVTITGIGYYPGKSTIKALNKVLTENPDFNTSNKFKIIVIHAFIEGQLHEIAQVSVNKLSELGVDYIGAGHYHIPWSRKELKIWVPGSSETTTSNDWRRNDMIDGISLYSSFIEVNSHRKNNQWESPNIITHKINVRPKIALTINSNATNAQDLKEEIMSSIINKILKISKIESTLVVAKPIVSIKIHSMLNQEDIRDLSVKEIQENLDLLHLDLQIEGLLNDYEISVENLGNLNIENLVLQLSGLSGDDGNQFLQAVTKIIEQYGKQPTHRDVSKDDISNVLSIINQANQVSSKKPLRKVIKKNDQPLVKKSKIAKKSNLEEWF